MTRLARNLGSALLDLLLPLRCHICRTVIENSGPLHICPDCHGKLPFISSPVCNVCGVPFYGAGDDHPCGRCLSDPPHYNSARAALCYDGACRELIHAFKYTGKSHLRRPLGLLTAQALADYAAQCAADLILPAPLHKKRLRMRGFNQALLLAEVLSDEWHIPLLRQALIRNRWTTPQMELDRNDRLHNLHGAFSVSDVAAIAGKRALLVDDVVTTGSTLQECARTLKKAGATAVFAVSVAHAP